MKVCAECGHEGRLGDFARWDLLCVGCRKAKGPQRLYNRVRTVREVMPPEPKVKPIPSGRKAIPRDERAVVVL